MKKVVVLFLLINILGVFSQELELKWYSAGIGFSATNFKISVEGNFIAIIDYKRLKIYDIKKNKVLKEYKIFVSGVNRIIDFYESTGFIYLASDRTMLRFDIKNETIDHIEDSQTHRNNRQTACSKTGDTVISIINRFYADGDPKVGFSFSYKWEVQVQDFKNNIFYLFDNKDFILYGEPYNEKINHNRSVAFSNKGNIFAIGNDSGYINIYELERIDKVKLIKQIKYTQDSLISGLIFSKDDSKLISTHSKTIKIWDIVNDTLIYGIDSIEHKPSIFSRINNDNKIVLRFENTAEKKDKYIKFDIDQRVFLDSIEIDKSNFRYGYYNLNEDYNKIAYSTGVNQISYSKIGDSSSIQLHKIDYCGKLAFTGQTKDFLIYSNNDSLIYFCNKNDGSFEKSINLKRSPIFSYKASPDGKRLLVFVNDYKQLWDIHSGTMIRELKIPNYNKYNGEAVYCFSPDSKTYWFAKSNNILAYHNSEDGQYLDSINFVSNPIRKIVNVAINDKLDLLTVGSYVAQNEYIYDVYDLKLKKPIFSSNPFSFEYRFIKNSYFITDTTLLITLETYSLNGIGVVLSLKSGNINFTYQIPENLGYQNPGKMTIKKLEKYPLFAMYLTNGRIWIYKLNRAEPIFYIAVPDSMPFLEIDSDSDSSFIYTFNDISSKNCYKLKDLFNTLDVDSENPVENKEYLSNDFIYPNPVDDYLYIKKQDYDGLIEVYNSIGEIFLLEDFKESIHVSHLNAGLYFVKIGNKVTKFIKN